MAVLNAQYKHPNSAYSQGLKNLIDSMLKLNPAERPDIHKVRATSMQNFIYRRDRLSSWRIVFYNH